MNNEIATCYSKVAANNMFEAVHMTEHGGKVVLPHSMVLSPQYVLKLEKPLEPLTTMCSMYGRGSRRGTEVLDNFMLTHGDDCLINHEGSAGAMESKGVVECFTPSIKKYILRYTEYLVNSDPYDGLEIKNLECLGHIQKRVGARLLKMSKDGDFNDLYEDDNDKSEENSKKRKREKLKLSDKDITKLQNYYGIATRTSTGETIWELKSPLLRSLGERHQFCPKTELSWCKNQSHIVNGMTTQKHKPGIDTTLMKLLKPAFLNPSSDELLSKCLHGKTQNNNESLNSIIWKRCPKDEYVGRTRLNMGVSSKPIMYVLCTMAQKLSHSEDLKPGAWYLVT